MRGQTFGEKAVGLTFNPSGDPSVNKVKELCAELIDLCFSLQSSSDSEQSKASGEKIRMLKIAITELQTAQMWAVKAITWND